MVKVHVNDGSALLFNCEVPWRYDQVFRNNPLEELSEEGFIQEFHLCKTDVHTCVVAEQGGQVGARAPRRRPKFAAPPPESQLIFGGWAPRLPRYYSLLLLQLCRVRFLALNAFY